MLTDSVDATMEPERETSGDTFDVSHRRPRNWKEFLILFLMLKVKIPIFM